MGVRSGRSRYKRKHGGASRSCCSRSLRQVSRFRLHGRRFGRCPTATCVKTEVFLRKRRCQKSRCARGLPQSQLQEGVVGRVSVFQIRRNNAANTARRGNRLGHERFGWVTLSCDACESSKFAGALAIPKNYGGECSHACVECQAEIPALKNCLASTREFLYYRARLGDDMASTEAKESMVACRGCLDPR